MSHVLLKKVNVMKPNWLSRIDGPGRLGVLLLSAALAWSAGASAGDVNYGMTGNGAWNASGSGVSLGAAITDINTNVEAGRGGAVPQHSANATLAVNQNEVAAGAGGVFGHWVLDGASNPGDYSLPVNGFNSVSINGGAASGGQAILNGNNSNMVLKVYHAAGIINIDNLRIVNGAYTLAGGALPAAFNGEVGGGGMTLGGNGMVGPHTGPAFVNVTNVSVSNNRIDVTTTTGTNAFGGGILVNGHGINGGVSGNYSDVTFTGVDLLGNSIAFTQTGGLGGSVRGGGARIGYAGKFTYNGGRVEQNTVTLTNGDHAAGGGLSVDGGNQYTDVILSGVGFESNSVTVNGSGGIGTDAVARGGAFYYLGTKTGTPTNIVFNNGTSFTGNSVEANDDGSSGDMYALGGAVHIMIDNAAVTFDGVNFTNNEARSDNFAGGGAVMAEVYAAYTNGSLSFANTDFAGNKATGVDAARGGAVYAEAGNTHTFTNTTLRQNSATASGPAGLATGGAISVNTEGTTSITGSVLAGNKAQSGEYAMGGAVYMQGGTLNIEDSSLTGNQAVSADFSKAAGGAIYMATDTVSLQPAKVTLSATAGKETLIQGNRAGGRMNGIHFGNDNGGVSNSHAELEINGPGRVSVLDPVTVRMNNAMNFSLKKSGSGEFAWDGANTFTTVGGTSTIDLDSGRIILGDTFTARAVDTIGLQSAFDVHIGSGATVEFSLSRDQNLAMFDFDNHGTKSLVVDNGATLTTSVGREVLSTVRKYAVATGASDQDLEDARDNFNFIQSNGMTNLLGLEVQGGTLYATVGFQSPFDTSGVNPRSALNALDHLMKAGNGGIVTDAEYAALLTTPYAATPELYMDQTHIMVNTVDMVARTAVDYGARYPYRQRMRMEAPVIGGGSSVSGGSSYGEYEEYYEEEYDDYYGAYPSLAYCDPNSGARVWGGYIGNLNRRDTHAGYQGYKIETHGFVIGANYDFTANGTLGIYGGYTSGESKARVSSSKIESDSGHFGVIGRMSPLTAAPEFSIYADGGYHFSYNDFHREVGGFRNDASFDQDLWTGAVGLEYMFTLGGMTLTPHIEGRYTHLEHQALKETGNSALSTYTDGVTKGTFNTRLGVEFSRDFQLACGVITPSVNINWKHEYGDRQYWSNAYFVKDPAAIGFSMSASTLDRDSADIGFALRSLYLTGSMKKIGLNASYNLNVSRRANVHSLYAGFDIGF